HSRDFANHFTGRIGGTIIDDDHLASRAFLFQIIDRYRERISNAHRFVKRGNDDRNRRKHESLLKRVACERRIRKQEAGATGSQICLLTRARSSFALLLTSPLARGED